MAAAAATAAQNINPMDEGMAAAAAAAMSGDGLFRRRYCYYIQPFFPWAMPYGRESSQACIPCTILFIILALCNPLLFICAIPAGIAAIVVSCLWRGGPEGRKGLCVQLYNIFMTNQII